jgi:hypothetical protein
MAVVAAFCGGRFSERRYKDWFCGELAQHLKSERGENAQLRDKLGIKDPNKPPLTPSINKQGSPFRLY